MDSFEFYSNLDLYNNKNSLQHSGSTLLGTQRENTKYYKREGTPGNYKYYYTKEEYEASKSSGNETNTNTRLNTKANKKSVKNNKNNNYEQNKQNQSNVSSMKTANKINNAKISNKYDKKFVSIIQNIDKMSKDERVEEYKNYLQDPENYTQNTYIGNRLTKLSEGGNVNLNLRPEIPTSELINAGWNKIDPELEEDSYATVYSGTYCNEKGDAYANFTPIIMNPETGEYERCMDPDEFQAYCEDIMDGRRTDEYNCQIGSWFTGEDAAKRADDASIEIHELHELQHENAKNKSKSD